MIDYRPVPDYLNYIISTTGEVCRNGRKLRGVNVQGYTRVTLSNQSGVKEFYVHRLVLLTFVGPCPKGMQCRHKDGDRTNNTLGNLVWGTSKENGADKIAHGSARGHRNPRARMTEEDVKLARQLRKDRKKFQEIALVLDLPLMTVYNAVTGKSWKHLP